MYARLEIDESEPMDFEEGSAFFDPYFNRKSDSEQELEDESATDRNGTIDGIAENDSMPEQEAVTLSTTSGVSMKSLSPNPIER